MNQSYQLNIFNLAINVYLMTHNVIQTKNGITISINVNVKNH